MPQRTSGAGTPTEPVRRPSAIAAARNRRAGPPQHQSAPDGRKPTDGQWAAVLFDLDGTLLDIDGEAFLDAYIEAMTNWWGPADSTTFRHAVMAAAVPIFAHHPDRTNGEVFRDHLGAHLGLHPDEVRARICRFHQEGLPALRPPALPVPDARACVAHCLGLGLRVAVATTPIYMPEVIALRLRWAGLADLPWDLVTHSERMHACKPHPAYFAEVADHLGLAPDACVMVGDDPLQDGPASQTGMAVLLRASVGAPGWRRLGEVAEAVTSGATRSRPTGRPAEEGGR